MKVLLALLLMTSQSLFALTQAEIGMKHPELAYVYQQRSFMEKDLLGDILLAQSMRRVPMGLVSMLTGKRADYYGPLYNEAAKLSKRYPKISRFNGEDAVYLKSMPRPSNHYVLNLESMKRVFGNVVQGMTVNRGSVPSWSESYKKDFRKKILPGVKSSKLLVCLMRGVCARFMLTGHEKTLEEWSLKRKDQSINPEILFKKALEFSQGDVSMALLTCHNLLSWHSKAASRWQTELQAKLRPFKTEDGHLSEDKFGEWYHLFGLMTYGFVKGSGRATFVGSSESYGGRLFSNLEAEVVEERVNSLAPKLAQYLSKLIAP